MARTRSVGKKAKKKSPAKKRSTPKKARSKSRRQSKTTHGSTPVLRVPTADLTDLDWLTRISQDPSKLEHIIFIQKNVRAIITRSRSKQIYLLRADPYKDSTQEYRKVVWDAEQNRYTWIETGPVLLRQSSETAQPDNDINVEEAIRKKCPLWAIDSFWVVLWVVIFLASIYICIGIYLETFVLGSKFSNSKIPDNIPIFADWSDCEQHLSTSDTDADVSPRKQFNTCILACNATTAIGNLEVYFLPNLLFNVSLLQTMEYFKSKKVDGELKSSMLWELIIQPSFAVLIYLFATNIFYYLTCGWKCSIKKKCGGKKLGCLYWFGQQNSHRQRLCCIVQKEIGRFLINYDLKLKQKRKILAHERLNITLNIFVEDKRENVPTRHRKHKIQMRTINEGPLLGDNGCFGGRNDALYFDKLINNTKPWDKIKRKFAPFLHTAKLRSLFGHICDGEWMEQGRKISKQMKDQIINRLSMFFGGAYICQDQGLHYTSQEYVFGITYEAPDLEKGTKQKCRVLVMRLDALKRMNELWREEPRSFDFVDNPYAWGRVQNLSTMLGLYQNCNGGDAFAFKNPASGQFSEGLSTIGRQLWKNKPWKEADGPLVGTLHIAASGPTFRAEPHGFGNDT